MKILLVNFEYPPLGGGGGVATCQIARELASRHEVHVLTTGFYNLPSEEVQEGIHVHRVPVLGRRELPTATFISLITFAPAAFLKGVFLFRSYAFDVVHAQFVIPSGVPAALLARMFRIPFVLTFIGGDVYDPSKRISPHRNILLRAVIRWISNNAVLRTAISHDTKTRTLELHGVRGGIEVIPIGLVPLSHTRVSRSSLGVPENAFVCATIGRLVPRKGYDVMLEAWKAIPNAHLFIMGNGPLKDSLCRTIEQLGLTDRVHLLGHVSEEQKQQFLLISDVYVSAAQHEGFGIVFLEAMDAGLPIVAANDGGQRDFLNHGEHALLVAPHDPQGVAHAITYLQQHPEVRARMAQKNKEDVKKYYITHTAHQFESVLVRATQIYEHRN